MFYLIKVSTSLYVENVIDAARASIMDSVECYVHVEKDGSISWTRYEVGTTLERDVLNVKCQGPTGSVFDKGAASTRAEDFRVLILSQPALYIEPMKNDLVIQASDSTARIEWLE